MREPEQSPAARSGAPNVGGDRRLAAVSFLDVVGYSAHMAQEPARTHEAWQRLLREIIRPVMHLHRGRTVKSTGDGVLAEFASAGDAVKWGCTVQRSIAEDHKKEPASVQLDTRIGVHIDEIFFTDDDIFGPGVNIAARLQDHADPGSILVSDTVFELVRGDFPGEFRDCGPIWLKNIPAPVKAHSLDCGRPGRPVRGLQQHMTLPSIAVLPLVNLGGDPTDDYFAEGVVEDIIVSLASLRELLVIARGSLLSADRRGADPRSAGQALGVRYVVSGTIRRTNERIRVAIQLHDAQSGLSLWGHRAEGAPGEVFEMQDSIVQRVVAAIAPHVRSVELRNALRKRPESFSAYDYTLQALERLHSLDRETFIEARELLNKAQQQDAGFAMPVAWAARWHSILIGQGWSADPRRDADLAIDCAVRAIALDGQNALALATYGHLRSYLFHDYDSALVYFDRALTACPNSAIAWLLSSGTLSFVGRGDEAVRHAEQAMRISPFDRSMFTFYTFLGLAHYAAGAYAEAVKWGRMALSEHSLYTANLRILAAGLAALGRLDEARDVAARLLALEPGFTLEVFARTLLPFRDEALREQYLRHLRKAALPP